MLKHQTPSENEEEIVALIAQQQPVLRALIRSMMPGQSECDDILQETNIVLWRKRETFTPGTNFNAWAGTIARYQVMAWRKRKTAHRLISFDDAVLERLVNASAKRWSNLSERRDALHHCISKLSEEQQQLIKHRYFKKSPLADYAKTSGRSFSAVRKSLERIRVSLRDCINHQLNEGAHS